MKGTIFYKMTGSGNDFIMLDGRSTTPDRWPADRIRALCNRRTGVGADGLVILTPQGSESVRMTYWNADGSHAAMCGNAALCSGRLIADLELVAGSALASSAGSTPKTICLLTDAGPVQVRACPGSDTAEVSMPDAGLPRPVPGLEPAVGERWLRFTLVGVPHLVVRVDDIAAVDVLGRGRALRSDPRLGSAGANVNFVGNPPQPGRAWPIRTYERGVEEETFSCGTGTVAAGLALAGAGEASLPVRFQSRGGLELQVMGAMKDDLATNIWLGGQSRLVFRGVWEG